MHPGPKLPQSHHRLRRNPLGTTEHSEMELLKPALLLVLLSTALAGPAGLWQDADISDKDLHQGWMDERVESSYMSLSSSSESQSSESESDEIPLSTASPTESPSASSVAPTGVPIAMTTVGTVLPGTDLPIVDNTTVPEQGTATPCATTGCVTFETPTDASVTDNRGDN